MLLEAKAGSVGELLAQIKYLAGSFRSDYRAPEEIWYRGQSSASFPLQADVRKYCGSSTICSACRRWRGRRLLI